MWYFEVTDTHIESGYLTHVRSQVEIAELPGDGSTFAIGFDIVRGAEMMTENPTPLPGVTPVDDSSLPCGYVWQSDGILHLGGLTVIGSYSQNHAVTGDLIRCPLSELSGKAILLGCAVPVIPLDSSLFAHR